MLRNERSRSPEGGRVREECSHVTEKSEASPEERSQGDVIESALGPKRGRVYPSLPQYQASVLGVPGSEGKAGGVHSVSSPAPRRRGPALKEAEKFGAFDASDDEHVPSQRSDRAQRGLPYADEHPR